MPTYARGQIVVEDQVGVYHCIARCVRRAFLCGVDPYTGQDFSHRKDWILDRMRELAGLFAIEVCGYSVMSNHLHLVLRNRPDVAEQWSDDEIALRWRRVFPPRDDATGEPVEPTEHDLAMLTANSERLLVLRKRLSNLSWFMRCLCEKIELGGNGARLRSAVQAGGGEIELACRCRGTLLEALVPGQGGGPNVLSVGHRFPAPRHQQTSL